MPTSTAPSADRTRSRYEIRAPLTCPVLILLVALLPQAWNRVHPDETWHSRSEIRAARRDAVWDDVPDSMTIGMSFEMGAQNGWVPWPRTRTSVGAYFDSSEPSLPGALGAWRDAAERSGWQPASASCDGTAGYGEISFTRTLADRPAQLIVERTFLHAPKFVVKILVGEDPAEGMPTPDPIAMDRCAPRS